MKVHTYAFRIGNSSINAKVTGLTSVDTPNIAVLPRAGIGALVTSPAAVRISAINCTLLVASGQYSCLMTHYHAKEATLTAA